MCYYNTYIPIMKCIKVYPILKKTFSDSLTYWINEDVEIADIIEAPLQNRKIWVVVDSVISVNEAKEFIKSQNFTIRKIENINKLNLFSQDFIFSVLKTANYYIKPFGEVFSEMIPKKILENLSNNIEITKSETKEINIFPIKEYLDANQITENILPIDLYKIDNEKIKTINIHHAESEYYRHLFKKFDYRYFIQEYCTRRKIKLNEIETKLELCDKNLYIIEQSSQNRTAIKKKNLDDEVYKTKLNLISPELFSALKKSEKNNESFFLYTLKKGYAPKTICPDCKHVMKCSKCFEDLEIDLKGSNYVFKCKNNHTPIKIDTPCPVCSNENLLPLGASIEVIYKEIHKEFDCDIVKIDNENNTKSQVKKTLNEYTENKDKKKSTIFIGNDYLVNQSIGLDFKFDNIAVISLESLFAIPLNSMEYEVYKKIALLSQQTNKNLIIQTRDIENPFWKNLQENNIKKIKNDDNLKELNLPPYSTHVQVSIPTEKSRKLLETVKDYLKHYTNFFEVDDKIKTTLHILIDKKDYLKNPIIYYLKSLPQYIKIEVDSRNLL
jgi:primosomal protein N'